jgi:hypothetical protein
VLVDQNQSAGKVNSVPVDQNQSAGKPVLDDYIDNLAEQNQAEKHNTV